MKKPMILAIVFAAVTLSAVGGNASMPVEDKLKGEKSGGGAKATEKNASYITPAHLRYPYIATHYINPIVAEGESVKIGWYVTDWRHSKARFLDDSPRFDVCIKYGTDFVNWKTLEKKNVRTGDGEFNLGKLPVGTYHVGVMCIDRKSNLPSYTSWQEFRVEPKRFFAISEEETYRMTQADFVKYGIVQDPGYERLVLIEMEDFPPYSQTSIKLGLSKVAEICRGNVDKYLAEHPHVPGRIPGYTIYSPSTNGVPATRAYERCRVVYDSGYDTNAIERTAVATGAGLQKLIDEKAKAGFRRLVLLPGVYRISNATPILMPANIEVDLNGSTLKLNQYAGAIAGIVKFSILSHDSALVNGTVEGDYFTHDYAHTPGHCEGGHGVVMYGGEYSKVENVTIRNITGYGGGNALGGKGKFGDHLSYATKDGTWKTVSLAGCGRKFVMGGLDWRTGELNGKDGFRYTSAHINVEYWQPFHYLSVSKFLGYQGILTRNWNYTVCFYDARGEFISGEVAMQYRRVFIPVNAKTARFSIEVSSMLDADKCGLHVALWKIPWNCVFRNCRLERCRCCGLATAAMRNFLFEGIDIGYSGESMVCCAVDVEDGGDMSQDVFFVRNNYHHIFRNGFIAARGHNIQVIGSRGHIHFYPSSYSPAVISNVCTTVSLGCSNRNRTGYWRYEGNEFEKLILGGCSNEVNSDWFSIIHDKTFKAGGLPRKISGGATGVFSNCTFDGVDVSVGSAINCTFRNSPGGYARGTGGRWKNCIFEDSKLQRCESTNIYQNCTFRNASAIFSMKCKQTFDGCTFENVKFGHHAGKGIEGEIRTNCKMKGENALPVEWIK